MSLRMINCWGCVGSHGVVRSIGKLYLQVYGIFVYRWHGN